MGATSFFLPLVLAVFKPFPKIAEGPKQSDQDDIPERLKDGSPITRHPKPFEEVDDFAEGEKPHHDEKQGDETEQQEIDSVTAASACGEFCEDGALLGLCEHGLLVGQEHLFVADHTKLFGGRTLCFDLQRPSAMRAA